MTVAYIGIGSNLDHPLQQAQRAVEALRQLPQSRLLACSPWYGSTAIGPGQQDDYVNGVVALETTLPPLALLDALQTLEHRQGRARHERWAARTLDLDILLYGQQPIADDRLVVPHPRMLERPFVLQPLLALAPALILPDGSRLRDRADAAGSTGLWLLEHA